MLKAVETRFWTWLRGKLEIAQALEIKPDEVTLHAAGLDRLRKRYREIRLTQMVLELSAAPGGSVFVTSVSVYDPASLFDPFPAWRAGRVFEVPLSLAAELLVDMTHVLSTPMEIERWKAQYQPEALKASC